MDNIERFFEKLKFLFEDHSKLRVEHQELKESYAILARKVSSLERSYQIEHAEAIRIKMPPAH